MIVIERKQAIESALTSLAPSLFMKPGLGC